MRRLIPGIRFKSNLACTATASLKMEVSDCPQVAGDRQVSQPIGGPYSNMPDWCSPPWRSSHKVWRLSHYNFWLRTFWKSPWSPVINWEAGTIFTKPWHAHKAALGRRICGVWYKTGVGGVMTKMVLVSMILWDTHGSLCFESCHVNLLNLVSWENRFLGGEAFVWPHFPYKDPTTTHFKPLLPTHKRIKIENLNCNFQNQEISSNNHQSICLLWIRSRTFSTSTRNMIPPPAPTINKLPLRMLLAAPTPARIHQTLPTR